MISSRPSATQYDPLCLFVSCMPLAHFPCNRQVHSALMNIITTLFFLMRYVSMHVYVCKYTVRIIHIQCKSGRSWEKWGWMDDGSSWVLLSSGLFWFSLTSENEVLRGLKQEHYGKSPPFFAVYYLWKTSVTNHHNQP